MILKFMEIFTNYRLFNNSNSMWYHQWYEFKWCHCWASDPETNFARKYEYIQKYKNFGTCCSNFSRWWENWFCWIGNLDGNEKIVAWTELNGFSVRRRFSAVRGTLNLFRHIHYFRLFSSKPFLGFSQHVFSLFFSLSLESNLLNMLIDSCKANKSSIKIESNVRISAMELFWFWEFHCEM